MKTLVKFFISCFAFISLFYLTGCGSENTATNNSVSGSVYTKEGPVSGALITIKNYNGEIVVSTSTDQSGRYRVQSNKVGPYIAMAKLPNGQNIFSISKDSVMNITHIGDFLLKNWYSTKKLDLASIFSSLDSATPLPLQDDLDAVADTILSEAFIALGENQADLYGNLITPALANILRTATIVDQNQINISLASVNFNATYRITSELNSSEEVLSDVDSNVTKASENYTAFTNKLLTNARIESRPNQNWMADIWNSIKDKKLIEIIIPGTHDSGTAFMDSNQARATARTQTGSFGTQLKDGIRYFDVRLEEAKHWGCADDSVWWFRHGPFRSKTQFMSALADTKQFLEANPYEFIILDVSDGDASTKSRDNLLNLIEKHLGSYLAKTGWNKKTLAELKEENQRVIVITNNALDANFKAEYKSSCGQFDKNNYTLRSAAIMSYYAEYANASEIKSKIIDAQLNKSNATNTGDRDKFDGYKTAEDKLRVIQVVTRPGGGWYAIMYTEGVMSGRDYFPFDLLTYTSYRINGLMNYKYNEDDALDWNVASVSYQTDFPLFLSSGSNCETGWLGKRLRMGIEGDPANWNRPNIVIVDNYDPVKDGKNPTVSQYNTYYDWILPDYHNGLWVKSQAGSYVDMIVSLNKIAAGDGARNSRLSSVTDLQDNQCLQ